MTSPHHSATTTSASAPVRPSCECEDTASIDDLAEDPRTSARYLREFGPHALAVLVLLVCSVITAPAGLIGIGGFLLGASSLRMLLRYMPTQRRMHAAWVSLRAIHHYVENKIYNGLAADDDSALNEDEYALLDDVRREIVNARNRVARTELKGAQEFLETVAEAELGDPPDYKDGHNDGVQDAAIAILLESSIAREQGDHFAADALENAFARLREYVAHVRRHRESTEVIQADFEGDGAPMIHAILCRGYRFVLTPEDGNDPVPPLTIPDEERYIEGDAPPSS